MSGQKRGTGTTQRQGITVDRSEALRNRVNSVAALSGHKPVRQTAAFTASAIESVHTRRTGASRALRPRTSITNPVAEFGHVTYTTSNKFRTRQSSPRSPRSPQPCRPINTTPQTRRQPKRLLLTRIVRCDGFCPTDCLGCGRPHVRVDGSTNPTQSTTSHMTPHTRTGLVDVHHPHLNVVGMQHRPHINRSDHLIRPDEYSCHGPQTNVARRTHPSDERPTPNHGPTATPIRTSPPQQRGSLASSQPPPPPQQDQPRQGSPGSRHHHQHIHNLCGMAPVGCVRFGKPTRTMRGRNSKLCCVSHIENVGCFLVGKKGENQNVRAPFHGTCICPQPEPTSS